MHEGPSGGLALLPGGGCRRVSDSRHDPPPRAADPEGQEQGQGLEHGEDPAQRDQRLAAAAQRPATGEQRLAGAGPGEEDPVGDFFSDFFIFLLD